MIISFHSRLACWKGELTFITTYSGSWERPSGWLLNDLVRQLPVVRTSGTTSSGKLEPVTVKEKSTSLIAATCMSAPGWGTKCTGKGRSCMEVAVERTR
ncbi:unnamed protein product, partial [Ectocarpus sp. 6 AP-2014]